MDVPAASRLWRRRERPIQKNREIARFSQADSATLSASSANSPAVRKDRPYERVQNTASHRHVAHGTNFRDAGRWDGLCVPGAHVQRQKRSAASRQRTQSGRTRQRWTPRKRGRVGATSDQPGQSRHSSRWGHALAAEAELDVAVGDRDRAVADFYDFAWWGIPVSMISATRRGTSANAGNAAMRLGTRTCRRSFCTALTTSSATLSGGTLIASRNR